MRNTRKGQGSMSRYEVCYFGEFVCGDKRYHSFHILAETLICDKCDKEFEIELEVTVKVTGTRVLN